MQHQLAIGNEPCRLEGFLCAYAVNMAHQASVPHNHQRDNRRSTTQRQHRRKQHDCNRKDDHRKNHPGIQSEQQHICRQGSSRAGRTTARQHRNRRKRQRQQPCFTSEDLADLPSGCTNSTQHGDLLALAGERCFHTAGYAHAAGNDQTAQQNSQQQELTFQLRICHDGILRKKHRHTLVVQSGICAAKLYLDECIILRLPVPVIEEACECHAGTQYRQSVNHGAPGGKSRLLRADKNGCNRIAIRAVPPGFVQQGF